MTSPLDHPIWTALTTRQAALAEGGARAKRFPPAMTPLAAIADSSPESFAELEALLAPTDQVALFTADALTPPTNFEVVTARPLEQMVGVPGETRAHTHDIVTLGAGDVPAMTELVELTKPGPFGPRTYRLGTFLGIRIDGRLAAMTGERTKPGDYTEITSVCTHPDYRGRGLAQILLAEIGRRIVAASAKPMLHVFSDNHAAIALYRRQGMETRRTLQLTVLRRRG